MDKLTAWIAFVAALSVATERITEIVKGFVPWLTQDKKGPLEELRKALIQILAVAIGTLLAALTYGQMQSALNLQGAPGWMCFVLGAMASGGSGLWNSALDIVREINRQKQVLTDKLKGV